jgi:hypothetical protein
MGTGLIVIDELLRWHIPQGAVCPLLIVFSVFSRQASITSWASCRARNQCS